MTLRSVIFKSEILNIGKKIDKNKGYEPNINNTNSASHR